uniref:Ubiquinone biosynthesis O-methyltransferase, mitochondrial n=1 Tax=Candidatus Methanogaster sp. ANME-2c ERB4 TaxID=2759911 RepID=A0A7G9YLE0_9EURY|nr:ubiquinone biosynthesis O-methyltransferase, mitochondrial [Methanosarcinales archaeon ANME-2c ERB4]
MSKSYYLYGKEKTFGETKSFIEDYFRINILNNPKNRYNKTLKYIPSKSYVLDYGCGWGILSKMLTDKGCRVDGIDLDKHSIDIAKDIIKENEFLKFENIPITNIPDEKYDYVISTEVIEHTHNPGNYLMECNRVLKKNGFLVLSLPNIINLRFFAAQLLNFNKKFTNYFRNFEYDKTHHHIQAWDPLTFMRLLASVGFEYTAHEFIQGMALPKGKYIHLGIPRIKNLSYIMIFKVQKKKFTMIGPGD